MVHRRFLLRVACLLPPLFASVVSCGGRVARISSNDAGSAELQEASIAPPNDAGGCGGGLQSGAPWPMFGQCPNLRGRSGAVGPASPTVQWFFPAPITAQPAIAADGTIYFGAGGSLYALTRSGAVRWTFTPGGDVNFGGTPAIRADGAVLVGAVAEPGGLAALYAVSAAGSLLWMYDTMQGSNGVAPSSSVGGDGTSYISTAYHLYAIGPDGSEAWQADAGDEYSLVPAIGSDGTLYVGGQQGLQAFTPGGQLLWAFGACANQTSECASQPSLADDGTIVATLEAVSASQQALLTALLPGGAPSWSLPTTYLGSGLAIGANGTIYLPLGQKVASVSPLGQQNWASALVGASSSEVPVVDGAGTLYVGTAAVSEASPCGLPCQVPTGAGLQSLHADGTSAWVFEPHTAFASPAIGADGTLYAAATGGPHAGLGLYAIGP